MRRAGMSPGVLSGSGGEGTAGELGGFSGGVTSAAKTAEDSCSDTSAALASAPNRMTPPSLGCGNRGIVALDALRVEPGHPHEGDPHLNAEAAVLPTKRLGTLEQIYLSFFWFSSNAHWGALLTVLVQSQVWVMVGDSRKAFGAGLVTSIGSITGILVPPLVGAWSDRVKFRIGRRRPFMVFGTLANLAALAGLATFPFMDIRTNL